MSNIDKILAERGQRYGEFTQHAYVTQNLKDAMVDSEQWIYLDDDQKECLEMVAHKIGRILNGDPNYIDSWTDIIGYTRLVEKRLIAEQESAKALIQQELAKALSAQEERNYEAPATLDSQAKAHIDAEQAANAKKKCDCATCVAIRAFSEPDVKPAANVMDLKQAREAKAADFDKRLREIEEKVHVAMRMVNTGFRFA